MANARKELAIQLRKEGKTYREILSEIPVAKSTLSEWLKSVKLAVPQKQRNTQLRKDSQIRGAEARRTKRISEIAELNVKGISEVGKLSARELWLIGTALHWAEGSKQRGRMLSTGIVFTNSDPLMLRVFMAWLRALRVSDQGLVFDITVHENRKSEIKKFKAWWEQELGLPAGTISGTYLKQGKISTNRTNIADLYHGIIRIRVRRSTTLNRQVNGWIKGIEASV